MSASPETTTTAPAEPPPAEIAPAPVDELVEMLRVIDPEWRTEDIQDWLQAPSKGNCISFEADDFRRLLTWANARRTTDAAPITPTDREMLDAALGRLATLPGWTLGDYSEFLQRLLAWADGRRDGAIKDERRLTKSVHDDTLALVTSLEAQIARLREALQAVVAADDAVNESWEVFFPLDRKAVELARAALEPAAEGGE